LFGFFEIFFGSLLPKRREIQTNVDMKRFKRELLHQILKMKISQAIPQVASILVFAPKVSNFNKKKIKL